MNGRATRQYVVCIRAKDAEDLEVRKLYERRTDAEAESRGLLRVIDESGEDYLYPAEWFVAVKLPLEAVGIFRAPARRRAAAPRTPVGLDRATPTRRR